MRYREASGEIAHSLLKLQMPRWHRFHSAPNCQMRSAHQRRGLVE